MKQFIFLLTLVLPFVFADCKNESDTPTSPPNNDASWTAVNSGLPTSGYDPHVRSLAVSGTNLFAGTGGGGVYCRENTSIVATATNKYNSDIHLSGKDRFVHDLRYRLYNGAVT